MFRRIDDYFRNVFYYEKDFKALEEYNKSRFFRRTGRTILIGLPMIAWLATGSLLHDMYLKDIEKNKLVLVEKKSEELEETLSRELQNHPREYNP